MLGNKALSALQWGALAAAGVGIASGAPAPVAQACGGLFCNASQPVNQAAERILFVDHGDGSTTAVIEIMYEGPSDRFAWVLPLGDIADPDTDIKVSSGMAFDRLQGRTNPTYSLNRTIEGECDQADFAGGFGGQIALSGGESSAPPPFAQQDAGVVVEASGSVGPFDYELISVTEGSDDPADVAVKWLTDNDYELGELGPDVLRPYLAEKMKLLAVRLTKGNDAGAIRPLSIRYQGDKPSIPIRPTAVAANDDMGIMVWVAGPSRAVPVNYRDLTLNEALINWFSAGSTYDTVVTAAADEAGGQGFVTEFAGTTPAFEGAVYFEEASFEELKDYAPAGAPAQLLQEAVWRFAGYDGFQDAVGQAVILSYGVTVPELINCPTCYLDGTSPTASLDAEAFVAALDEQVVGPLRETEALLLSQPYVSRLYTTMSADEMSMDPLFDFNADLPDLSNLHTAEQIIECAPGYTQFDAPFRVELDNGIVVHGTQQGTWPVTYDRDKMPANLKIAQAATSGAPKVMVDNVALIKATLNGAADEQGKDSAGTGGVLASGGDSTGSGGTQATQMGGGAGICAVSTPGRGSSWAFLAPLAVASLWRARRRKGSRAA